MEDFMPVITFIVWVNILCFIYAAFRKWGEFTSKGVDIFHDEEALTEFANALLKYAFIAPYFAVRYLWWDFANYVVYDGKNDGTVNK